MKLIGFLIVISFASYGQSQISPSSWHDAKIHKQGTIVCYWFDSNPFIDLKNGQLTGIEYDLIMSFVEFVDKSYGIKLKVEWIRGQSFNDVLQTIKQESGGSFGLSAFSITEERKKAVSFTPSYLPDISVLITSRNIPDINSEEEFRLIIKDATAVTIPHTTFEKMIHQIKEESNLNFDINYISSNNNILKTITAMDNGFGYIALPTYLSALENNIPIRRQPLYSFYLEGISIIYPINSDWTEPITTYFSSLQFKLKRAQLISQYFGEDVFALTEKLAKNSSFSSNEEVLLLTKEKQIQSRELLETTIKIQREKMIRNLLIVGVFFVLLTTAFMYSRYIIKSKANEALTAKQEEIKKRNIRLTKLDKEKNNLIKVLAHDLRSPIGQISGLVEIVKSEKGTLSESQVEVLDQIIKTSSRVNNMVSKILDIEALESNKINLTLEPIDIEELLTNVIHSYQDHAEAKQIKLIKKIDNGLASICADLVYTTQIFENLISNAIKFSEPDKQVTISTQTSAPYLIVEIEDQGPGISEADQKNLFKKFQKLTARPTTGEDSTGLGLSIVKKYVSVMKGSVWCQSELGKGTSFFVKLPLA